MPHPKYTPTYKEVIAIYTHKPEKKFLQFLKKSEVGLLTGMCKDLGRLTIEIDKITAQQYKIEFGI